MRPTSGISEGLSPRVRGNLSQIFCQCTSIRSIPTSAGKPVHTRIRLRTHGVYPHECGETSARPPGRPHQQGLSPRVRGNRTCRLNITVFIRSIPTSAGKPSTMVSHQRGSRVYPHECGETLRRSTPDSSNCGLSPRVRGNLNHRENDPAL